MNHTIRLVRKVLAAAMLVASIAACAGTSSSIDDHVRMNEIQVLGSHNSYHVGMSKEIFDLVHAFSASSADALDYHHPSLETQLTREGARQLEIDVYADPNGGLF